MIHSSDPGKDPELDLILDSRHWLSFKNDTSLGRNISVVWLADIPLYKEKSIPSTKL